MNNTTKIIAVNEPWYNGIQFLIRQGQSVCTNLMFEEIPEGQLIQSSISLKREDAQELMDTLWQCGLRPSEGTGSAGSLKATENHLADMRKITFKYLEL